MRTIIYAAMAATAALALSTGTASAGNPHGVDPTSVTPPLSPDFDPWSCFATGGGITCQGLADGYYDTDIELVCGGRDVHVVGREQAGMTRWHDDEGRALKSEVRRKVVDRLTLSGTDDPAVHLSIHEARHYYYPVAGDLAERVLRESGAVFVLRSEEGGLLFQDTGHLAYAPGDESAPAGISGNFDSWTGVETLDEAICRGLMR
jgi:hypothetical protein